MREMIAGAGWLGRRLFTALVMGLALGATAGQAQTAAAPADTSKPARLRGIVVTADTGVALPDAQVILVGLDQEVTTDAQGRFDFGVLAPDSYIIQVRRIGYKPRGIKANLAPGSTLDLQIPMTREVVAQQLQEIVTTTPAAKGGFYERMKTGGMGSYITREDIEQKHAAYAGELLQGVPGMRVRCGGARCQIVNVRGSCTPTFFMNGARSDLNMLQEANIQPDDIDAIEVYRSAAETPGQYSGGDECGTIVLWTRYGPSKGRK